MASFSFNTKSVTEAPVGKHYCSNPMSKVNGCALFIIKGKTRTSFYLRNRKLKSPIKLGVFPAISVQEARLELAKRAITIIGDTDAVTRKVTLQKSIPTLADGIQEYITKHMEGMPSQKNQQRLYDRRIANHPLAKLPMDEIEMGHAKDFLKDLALTKSKKGGYLTVDVNHCRQLCSAAYNYHLERNAEFRKSHFNAFGFKNTIKVVSTEKDHACIDPEVLGKIMKFLGDTNFSHAKVGCYLTSLFTGQHNSEIFRMKWSELKEDGFWVFTNLKNPDLKHKTYLNPILQKYIQRFGNRSSEYVFETAQGNLVRDLQKMNVAVNKMLNNQGYDIRFNSQHHRHSVGLYLLSNGFMDSQVQRILGHTPSITLHKAYVPVSDDVYKQAMVHWYNHIIQNVFIDSVADEDWLSKKESRVIKRQLIKKSEATFIDPHTR